MIIGCDIFHNAHYYQETDIFILFLLVACHLIGDYVLQVDYIAKTKADNKYHLFVHSFLYTVPFSFLFYRLMPLCCGLILPFIFISHFIIDELKCRDKINYTEDQVLHYFVIIMIWLFYLIQR